MSIFPEILLPEISAVSESPSILGVEAAKKLGGTRLACSLAWEAPRALLGSVSWLRELNRHTLVHAPAPPPRNNRSQGLPLQPTPAAL